MLTPRFVLPLAGEIIVVAAGAIIEVRSASGEQQDSPLGNPDPVAVYINDFGPTTASIRAATSLIRDDALDRQRIQEARKSA